MGNPPPLPINSGAPSNSGIFRQAATLSLVIPTLIGVATRFSLELGKAHPGPTGQLIMLGAAAVSSITIFIGLAFGIAAATGASGKGEGRVRVRGAAGILINSVLLAVFITGFVKGYTKIQPSARDSRRRQRNRKIFNDVLPRYRRSSGTPRSATARSVFARPSGSSDTDDATEAGNRVRAPSGEFDAAPCQASPIASPLRKTEAGHRPPAASNVRIQAPDRSRSPPYLIGRC